MIGSTTRAVIIMVSMLALCGAAWAQSGRPSDAELQRLREQGAQRAQQQRGNSGRPSAEEIQRMRQQQQGRSGAPSREEIERIRQRYAPDQGRSGAPSPEEIQRLQQQRGGQAAQQSRSGAPSQEEIERIRQRYAGQQSGGPAAQGGNNANAAGGAPVQGVGPGGGQTAGRGGDLEQRVAALESQLDNMQNDLQLIKALVVQMQNQR